MTTNEPTTGRSAATPRPTRASLRFLCCLLLGSAALPAFASPVSLATDSAEDVFAPSAITSASLAGPAALPDRALMFAGDINRLISTQPADAGADKPASGRIQSVLKRALALLGTPYRWGGTSTDGFDCSGLVGYVFRSALGIELPRVSRDMANSGERVERASLSAGDLVFFSRRGARVDHVGIYVGNGQFVHAPRTGKDVMVSDLDKGYWSGKFMQARRVAGI